MKYRPATARDVAGIAALHADSWRRNYRGAYLDTFLDGDVVADRLAVWTARLDDSQVDEPRRDAWTIVAEAGGSVVGFAHTIFDADPRWGALLENLHVAHDLKRTGVGTRLTEEAARVVIRQRPSMGIYLTVLEQNTSAQAFYAALGGRCVGRKLAGPFPGGGHAVVLTYCWPDPAELIDPM